MRFIALFEGLSHVGVCGRSNETNEAEQSAGHVCAELLILRDLLGPGCC